MPLPKEKELPSGRAHDRTRLIVRLARKVAGNEIESCNSQIDDSVWEAVQGSIGHLETKISHNDILQLEHVPVIDVSNISEEIKKTKDYTLKNVSWQLVDGINSHDNNNIIMMKMDAAAVTMDQNNIIMPAADNDIGVEIIGNDDDFHVVAYSPSTTSEVPTNVGNSGQQETNNIMIYTPLNDNMDSYHAFLEDEDGSSTNSSYEPESIGNNEECSIGTLDTVSLPGRTDTPETSVKNSRTQQDVCVNQSRKRRSNVDSWLANSSKKLRNSGQSYVSCKTKKQVRGRALKPPCSEKCKHSCRGKFTEEERLVIFNSFWEMGAIQRQRDFIAASTDKVVAKYKYQREGSTRNQNSAFYLTKNGNRIRVCKHFFIATLDISQRAIRTVMEKRVDISNIVSTDLRGKHNSHKQVDDSIKEAVRKHINAIPRIPSHYCRAHTNREYIDGSKSVADIHRDYVEKCVKSNEPYVNYVMFYRIFTKEFNIAFFTPKKDQCEQCVSYQNATREEKEKKRQAWETHLREKELARLEKKKDKEETNNNTIVACYDLQAVFQCPRGDISVFYYKLNVFNLTFFELKSTDVTCYVWHEGEAERGVNEIGSCVLQFIEKKSMTSEGDIDLIFYTDNCGGQQKNRFMIRLYQYAIAKFANVKSIVHNFLIKGHTQNEGDCAHSMIEREVKRTLKSGPIYTPHHFVSICRSAKKTGQPFNVVEMSHKNFFDVKNITREQETTAPFKNIKKEIVKISEVKVLRFTRDAPLSFYYKTSYGDSEFEEVDLRVKTTRTRNNWSSMPFSLLPAYSNKLSLPKRKKDDLIEHNHIPSFYASFFNDL